MDICAVSIFRLSSEIKCSDNSLCFLCVMHGQIKIEIPGSSLTLSENESAMLSPGCPRKIIGYSNAMVLYINVNSAFILDEVGSAYFYKECRFFSAITASPNPLFASLYHIASAFYKDRTDDRFFLRSTILILFDYLSSILPNNCPSFPITNDMNSKAKEKANDLYNYMLRNSDRPLSLSDVAHSIGWAPQYLSSFIRQHFNMTFSTMLSSIRAFNADLYLLYTNYPTTKIASICGYSNQPSFQKSFRSITGFSPEQYRVKNEAISDPLVIDYRDKIQSKALALDYIQEHIQATPPLRTANEQIVHESFQFSTASMRPNPYTSMQLINLGKGSDFKYITFRYQLTIMQKDLHFKYGRIQGLFSRVNVISQNSDFIYDFHDLFDILDFLTSIHIIPMIEIGDKPFEASQLILNPDNLANAGNMPADIMQEYDRNLQAIFPAFIKESVNRYGRDTVSKWMLEVIIRNSDNLQQYEAPSVYFNRFLFVQKTAKKFAPQIKVGGPGFHTTMPAYFFGPLIAGYGSLETKPDFISLIVYPHEIPRNKDDINSAQSYLTNNPDFFMKRIQEIMSAMDKSGMGSIPLGVSEFGSYCAYKNYINDSFFQACFIAKQILENYRSVSFFGYWLASDLSLVYRDRVAILFGGNGLITRSGIGKPSYFAFRYINNLGSYIIASGKHFIATTNAKGCIRVIFYYYAHFSHDFRHHQDNYEQLRFPRSAFEEVPWLSLSLKLTNLPAGTYRMRKNEISSESGNLVQCWQDLGYPISLLPQEIDYLKSASYPNLYIETRKIIDSITLEAELEANELIYYDITRIYS